MITQKQEELLRGFLSSLGERERACYGELAACLIGLGYYPQREKARISFKHRQHKKQVAKMGFRQNLGGSPFFALRFSACHGYSRRFQDVVAAAVTKSPCRTPLCISGGCHFCAGEPAGHVYAHTLPGGEARYHCGAYALEIPDVAEGDAEEIKALIREEHAYLMRYEAGGPEQEGACG